MTEKLKPCPFCGGEAKPVFRGGVNYEKGGRAGMNWYLIELPDGAPTPYATETEGGTIYGWGDMPKRKVDLDALSKVIEDLLGTWGDGKVDADDADTYEHKIAERIRKAVRNGD